MYIKELDCLSTRDMRAICMLAETRNFHKAAELCNMSQPALSAIVKKVEGALNSSLFNRHARLFEITDKGLAVIERFNIALKSLSEIQVTNNHNKILEGIFRVGFIPTIGPYLIPRLIKPLIKKFPKLELSFTEATTETLADLLIQRKLDAAIVAIPLAHPRLTEIPLLEEELVLAVSSKDPLSKKSKLSITEINHQELLLMQQEHCLRGNVLESCGAEKKQARTVHSTSLETLLFMVEAGVGYTFVPKMAVTHRGLEKNITFINFKKPAPTRRIGLVFPKASDRNIDISYFSDFLNEIL